MNNWTEIKVNVNAKHVGTASDIAHMTVPYGIYIEDYSNLEQEAYEVAHIDLIDEELLQKNRDIAIIHIYIKPDENPMEAISFLKERLDAAGIENSIETENCAEEDWINNWKQYFKPIPVGNKLLIRPSWIDDYDKGDRVVLSIEPGLAFGTGTHATTRLCLEAMEDYINPETTLLDLGCGSGILSIAGLLLGAKNATGVDIDSIAVKTAIENGEENNFREPQYRIIHGDLTDKITEKYDVIVANIIADVIIYFCSVAGQFMKDDAVFIVSGIVDTREDDVVKAFNDNGFKIKERREENGWLCFALCK